MTDHDMIFLLLSLVIILIAAQGWTQKRLASYSNWIAAATKLLERQDLAMKDMAKEIETQAKRSAELAAKVEEIAEQVSKVWDHID